MPTTPLSHDHTILLQHGHCYTSEAILLTSMKAVPKKAVLKILSSTSELQKNGSATMPGEIRCSSVSILNSLWTYVIL